MGFVVHPPRLDSSAASCIWTCAACGARVNARKAPRFCDCGLVGGFIASQASEPTPSAAPVVCAADIPDTPPARLSTGHRELDSLLGGGVVVGSVVLIYGRRGAGKSRTTYRLASATCRCLVSHPELSTETAAAIVRSTGADPRRVLLTDALNGWQQTATRLRVRSVVLDSLSAYDNPVTELRQAQQWAQRHPSRPVVWCINHATKRGDFRGDAALAHWADYEVRLRRDRKREQVSLDVLKQRLGPEGTVSLPLCPRP